MRIIRADITSVAHAVRIGVCLIGVCDGRAVVHVAADAVAVGVRIAGEAQHEVRRGRAVVGAEEAADDDLAVRLCGEREHAIVGSRAACVKGGVERAVRVQAQREVGCGPPRRRMKPCLWPVAEVDGSGQFFPSGRLQDRGLLVRWLFYSVHILAPREEKGMKGV